VYARVVVAYDGSTRSLSVVPAARIVAARLDHPLELIHVGTADEPDQPVPDDLPVRTIVGEDPGVALLDEVRASDPPALMCMTTHGRGALGELVFGNVAAKLLRELHAPVLTVGPQLLGSTEPRPWSRMLICLDGSATAASILPIARRWAEEFELSLHLLHVTYPLGDVRLGDAHIPVEVRAITAELERTATELSSAGVDATFQVIEDTDTVTGIVRHAAHRSVDLIAMATHGRSGLARLLAGSTTLATVRRSPVPLLLLRPERLH